MLYQLSYASPPSAPAFPAEIALLTTPENRPEPSEIRGHTALRAFFGTELKVSIALLPEQTGSSLCMPVENRRQRPSTSQSVPHRHTGTGIEAS